MIYDWDLGPRKFVNDKNEKFYFVPTFPKGANQETNFYYARENPKTSFDKLITLEMKNRERNNLGKILVRDIDGENIIYEITAKIKEEYDILRPTGIGLVHNHRDGEILIVNFDNDNIISHNLQDLSLFIDKEEFNMNKNDTEDLTNNKNNSRKFMNDIINTASETINLEKIANKINNKIIEEKIKNFGIKDQEYSSQCWVYSLSEIIYMANARKYGRKLEDFHQIYNTIVNIFGKGGKTNEQMEIIMSKILPLYNLKYEKIENEEKLKNFLKKGIKCIATFKLNEKEWNNFSEYFNDYKIKDEEKLLTMEILERQNDKVEDSGKTTGHSVILTDIDNDDNYLLINSWGKNWGNKGIFKSKKECLKSSAFYAIYFTTSELSQEEVEEWDNLIKDINKYLKNLKNIRY